MSNNNKSQHDLSINEAVRNPKLVGLDGIIMSTGEVNLFDEKKVPLKNNRIQTFYTIVTQPDAMMFDPSTKTIYHFEKKCHDTNIQYNHAKYQLEKRQRIIQEQLFPDWRSVKLYMHDGYEIEKIN
jgi:hypothetical protein